jgi:hypothetical protein
VIFATLGAIVERFGCSAGQKEIIFTVLLVCGFFVSR